MALVCFGPSILLGLGWPALVYGRDLKQAITLRARLDDPEDTRVAELRVRGYTWREIDQVLTEPPASAWTVEKLLRRVERRPRGEERTDAEG